MGSFVSILQIKSSASELTLWGKTNSPLLMRACRSFIFVALNGTVPINMAYMRTPNDQMSTANPEYPSSEIISGAI